MKKETVYTLIVIAFVLSFFVTPLGYYSKVWLNTIFSFSPTEVATEERQTLSNYEWKLKDENWGFFNFNRSMGKVVFINFWASWRLQCEAELKGIQTLYDTYGDRVDFYIVTNEERPPVEKYMARTGFTFPVTYLIIGKPAPLETQPVPSSYIIDKNGMVVIRTNGIKDWDNKTVQDLLDRLIAEE
ncbi:thiol:disulfide interchange protein tlpA [hydrothermal vent metagenome]|uniref:Thiol:disulfide interchange protein tlpA n=1 Tax=hydrothermal vent metagenome TaxID=652676 RepID=A0A3B0T8P1_9ZZZZ